MKSLNALKRSFAIAILALTVFPLSVSAAEYVQMKAQGYQPVITPQEAQRRVELGLDKDKMVPLAQDGLGRKTILEAVKAGQSEPVPAAQGGNR